MNPPFRSRSKAIRFALFLATLIASPLLTRNLSYSKDALYKAFPVEAGPYAYIDKQIFNEKTDLDIAVMGSSYLWQGINPLYIKEKLSQKLGREARVQTLGFRWAGQDLQYLMTKDLIEHRRVKMIVTYMPNAVQTSAQPHSQMYRIFEFKQDAELFEDSNIFQRLSLYASVVLGTPRHLLSLYRKDQTAQSEFEGNLGANLYEGPEGEKIVHYETTPPEVSVSSMIYSEGSKQNFDFDGEPLNSYQINITRRLFRLCQDNHIVFVVTNVPLPEDRNSPKVKERMNWKTLLGTSVEVVGLPPKILFSGKSDEEFSKFYWGHHLNRNGNEYLTKALTPAFLEIYDRQIRFN